MLADAEGLARKHKLYGRDGEVAQLLTALQETVHGEGEILLLPGISGTGKTALAKVLREPIRALNGFFLEGKFNQYDQNVPYVAWRQALAEFCESISQEDEARNSWLAVIEEAVGGQGELLVSLVPEFEQLLGKQAPVESINPLEAQHRFASLIRSVLKTACSPERPLVLFLDDWQWADSASLHLLSQLQVGSTLRYILIVAAYRSDEIDERHSFAATLDELRSQAINIKTTEVNNLAIDDVERMVSEAVAEFSSEPAPLAADIHAKSKGNPFFAHALVDLIQSEGSPSAPARDAAKKTVGLASDVVAVFVRRINNLEPNCQELLSIAAVLGNRFDLDTLSMVSQRSVQECQDLLLTASTELVEPLDKLHTTNHLKNGVRTFQFTHDRVQQAAYSRIPATRIAATRLNIARQMHEHFTPEQLSERVCEVVEHFNLGVSLVVDSAERIRGVELNLLAGRRVRAATAYRSALQYHRAARACLDTPELTELIWRNHASLAISLFTEQAETEFLEGDREEAERCVRIAGQRAQTPIQKAEALSMLIVHYTLQARYTDAIAAGREALSELGMSLPDRDYETARDSEIVKTRQLFQGMSPDDVLALPIATDETMKATAKVLITMGPPCYRAHQQLWSVIVPRVVNLTLRHGNIPEVGYSHTAFTGLLGWVANDYTVGRDFSEIAANLMAGPLPSAAEKSVFHLMIGSSVRHWYRHLVHSSEDYDAAVQTGRQSGNLQYAAYAFGHNMYCRFFQGTRLDELVRESQSSLTFSRTRFNQWAIDLLEGGIRIFGNLSTWDQDPNVDWEFDYLERVESHGNHQVGCIYRIIRSQQCIVMGDLDEAMKLSEESKSLIDTVGTQGLLPWAEYVFARVLVTTGLCLAKQQLGEKRQTELDEMVEQLRIWSVVCPENFQHKHLLAKAELARLNGLDSEAIELYDRAIESAHDGGFVQWEGLANERAAKYWRAKANGRLEQLFWQQAYQCYEQWGATAKLAAMAVEYRETLAAALGVGGGAKTLHIESKVADRFLDKHVQSIRDQNIELSKIREQAKSALMAEELANAADSLRADVAARRRAVEELGQEREELERRVRERTEELQRLGEIVDRSQNEIFIFRQSDFQFVYANAGAVSNLGYSLKELNAMTPLDLELGVTHEQLSQMITPLRDGRQDHLRIEARHVRKDRSFYHVDTLLQRTKYNGDECFVANVVNTTEIKKFIDKLQRANDELEQFAYVASHDLRSPLRGIASIASFLREDEADNLSESSQLYLDKLDGRVRRMEMLLDDLLAYSRAGQQDAPQELVNICDLIGDVVDLVAPPEGFDIVVRGELPILQTYATPLRQVFLNLIGNAVKHHDKQSGLIEISATEFNGFHLFTVHDNGPGIEEKYHAKVFELFQRLETRKTVEGSGMGLSIVRRLVRQFGGDVSIESEFGTGTSFLVTWPNRH